MDIPKGIVLIVDDERDILEIIQAKLEVKGYYCITHYNPDKAMDEIEKGLVYSLAFIDITYDGKKTTGEDLVRVSIENNPNIPIYTISGFKAEDKQQLDRLSSAELESLKLNKTRGVVVKDTKFYQNIEAVVEKELR